MSKSNEQEILEAMERCKAIRIYHKYGMAEVIKQCPNQEEFVEMNKKRPLDVVWNEIMKSVE